MTRTIEFLAFSDAHWHEYTFGAKEKSYSFPYGSHLDMSFMHGVNSRLIDCMNATDHVVNYAMRNGIKHILFGGDLFHTKKDTTITVVNMVHASFAHYETLPVHFTMIPGNHDYVDKEGKNHALISLGKFKNVTVIDAHSHIDTEFYRTLECEIFDDECGEGVGTALLALRAVPYTEDKEFLKDECSRVLPCAEAADASVLLLHTGFQGAKVGSDYVMVKDHDLSVSDIPASQWDVVLSGHYHTHQKVFKNGWIIGSTHQMNWSDAGGLRGFVHVKIHLAEDNDDENRVELIHIPTDESIPKFHILDADSDLSVVRAHDFVKYKVSEQITDELKDNITGFFAATLERLPQYLELIPAPLEKKEISLSEKAVSPDTILDEWVLQSKTDIDSEKLLQAGRELLTEARKSFE